MIRPFIVGFFTTFKHIFKKPITVNYPDEKIPVFPKWRGMQVLLRDESVVFVGVGALAVASEDEVRTRSIEVLTPSMQALLADLLQQPYMQNLKWLRAIGDTIFAAGIISIGWFVFKSQMWGPAPSP